MPALSEKTLDKICDDLVFGDEERHHLAFAAMALSGMIRHDPRRDNDSFADYVNAESCWTTHLSALQAKTSYKKKEEASKRLVEAFKKERGATHIYALGSSARCKL